MVTKKTTKAKAAEKKEAAKKERYYEGRGGRKTSVARARVYMSKSGISVNDKDYKEYFKVPVHQAAVEAPFAVLNQKDLGATIKVYGGGATGQAEAVRHALAQALVKMNPDFRAPLRQSGFLTRDDRMVERKKYGLKKARRAPQWAKR